MFVECARTFFRFDLYFPSKRCSLMIRASFELLCYGCWQDELDVDHRRASAVTRLTLEREVAGSNHGESPIYTMHRRSNTDQALSALHATRECRGGYSCCEVNTFLFVLSLSVYYICGGYCLSLSVASSSSLSVFGWLLCGVVCLPLK